MKYAEIEISKHSGRGYTYSVPTYLENEIEIGDRVAVLVRPRGNDHGSYMLGKVLELVDYPRTICPSECIPIIDKVDTKRWKAEKEKVEQRQAIEAAMEARLKETSKLNLYRQMAEADPKMKELLDSYDALNG